MMLETPFGPDITNRMLARVAFAASLEHQQDKTEDDLIPGYRYDEEE